MTRRQFLAGCGIMAAGALVPTVADAAGQCTDNTSRFRQHTTGGRSQPGRTTRYGQYSGGTSPNCGTSGQNATTPTETPQDESSAGDDNSTSRSSDSGSQGRNTATRRR